MMGWTEAYIPYEGEELNNSLAKLEPTIFDKFTRITRLFGPVTMKVLPSGTLSFHFEASDNDEDSVFLATDIPDRSELSDHDRRTVLRALQIDATIKPLQYPDKYYDDMREDFEYWLDKYIRALEKYIKENNPLRHERRTPGFTFVPGLLPDQYFYTVQTGDLTYNGFVQGKYPIPFVYAKNKTSSLHLQAAYLDNIPYLKPLDIQVRREGNVSVHDKHEQE